MAPASGPVAGAILLSLALWPPAALADPSTAHAAVHTAVHTVYAAGDIARCKHPDPRWSGAAATATLVEWALRADPHAVVLTLGDHTYPNGTAREFADCYGPTWGRFRARTWPTPGNHEYNTQDALPYFDYFGQRARGVDGHGYYGLRLGAWHIVALNSNLEGERHAAQLAWLRTELAGSTASCTLAFWHHPSFSSGGHRGPGHMHDAWDILHRAGAELVLSGHDHDYERFAPQDARGRPDPARGMRQFVVGTGGAYATPFLRIRDNSEVREASFDGVLRLRLLADGYEWQFLAAVPERVPAGATLDRGTGSCH